MAQPIKDSFLNLERHRQLLEDNIANLQKSLQHWQTWEAEYEGLKEEILASSPFSGHDQLVAICQQYEGDLVTKKEIDDILGYNSSRSADQVINILDRRMDYVEQNVCTIQNQIEVAENKLAAATVISTPDVRNEDGLPLTEIIEELDDEGNVISSRISTPGSTKPQLLEVLQKAGVKDIQIPEQQVAKIKENSKTANIVPKREHKGVTFTDDTKPGPAQEKSKTAKRLEDIMKLAKQSEICSEPPIVPTNESREDSALRRDMLQYGMNEVGAVVAELDFEEGSDWSDEGTDDADVTSSDDEDAFGRSTSRVVDDELRQRMIELEKRLGARVMENIGKKASDYEIVPEGIGRVMINGREGSKDNNWPQSNSSLDTLARISPKDGKKSVRFSNELDIAYPANTPATGPISAPQPKIPVPVSDVVERAAPGNVIEPTATRKVSQPKAARVLDDQAVRGGTLSSARSLTLNSTAPLHPADVSGMKPYLIPLPFTSADDRTRVAPTGPEGKTLASTIVEREVALDIEAVEPDEHDPHLLNQEVSTEYHRLRNRMIQRQGGFMKEVESEVVPYTEEEGGPKKVSRFKAARLARS
jgi:unconventional prefoldin RPB5 interactor 1